MDPVPPNVTALVTIDKAAFVTIDKADLGQPVGKLPGSLMSQIDRGLRRVLNR